MKTIAIKMVVIFIAVLLLGILSPPFLNACIPVLEFGDLTVSVDIDPDTAAPIGPGTVFDFDNEWNAIINYFQGNKRTYMMLTIARENFYEAGMPVYQGIFNSFSIVE